MEWRLQRYNEVDSTNRVVKEALGAGEAEGFAVTACTQRGGYGRQGRAWASPEGGMYLSLLLRPSPEHGADLSTVSLAVAVAVRRACAALVTLDQGKRLAVKWPNDVVVLPEDSCPGMVLEPVNAKGQEQGHENGCASTDRSEYAKPFSKICGISLEAVAGGICVGIGVNVEPAPGAVALPGKNRAAYLADLGYGAACEQAARIEEVCQSVLDVFAAVYEQWNEQGFASLQEEFNEHHCLAGRWVSLVDRNGDALGSGRVESVDAAGQLLLRDANGTCLPMVSGEAHIL